MAHRPKSYATQLATMLIWSLILTGPPASAAEINKILTDQRAVIERPQRESDRPQVNWYWRHIRKIAASEFGGMDIELAFTPSYKVGGDDEGIKFGATIPLYSKEKKLARKKASRDFLEAGAKLCAQLEEALQKYLIYQQAYANYEMLAQDEGAAMLDKLVDVQVKIVQQEALITQSHRQLQAFIKPFSTDVKILSWDKVQ